MRLFGLGYYDTWYYFHLDYSWVNGALLFFYVKSQLFPDFKFDRKDLVHLIPLAIQIPISIFVRFQNFYWDGTRESLSWAGYWGYVVWMNYPSIYVIASLLIIIYAYKALLLIRNPESGKGLNQKRLSWIKRILGAFAIYFSLVLSILIVDLLIYNVALGNNYFYFTRFFYYPFFGGLALLTYWLGMEGFRRKDDPGLVQKAELSNEERMQLEALSQKLKTQMQEEKWYSEPELSLSDLAERLDVKPYLLSRCFSEILNQRFSDYVNVLRVNEVESKLRDPENEKYTLLSLAMDAGFNSKSSFNRAVQKHLGLSPNELRKRMEGFNSENDTTKENS